MPDDAVSVLFIGLDFAVLLLYHLRAFSFCSSLLELSPTRKLARPLSFLLCCLLLAAVLSRRLPMLLGFLIVYLTMLLQFCLLFQGNIRVFLFGSGNFLFHLMDIQMIVSAVYVLVFRISTPEAFGARYPSCVFLTLLLVVTFLEVFRRSVDREALRLLLQNDGQLLFANSSMLLIDVYLLILSVSYGGQAYSAQAAIFLLCTGFLLFGAFYTAFQHAVRMSTLLQYEKKSVALERELVASNEYLGTVLNAASTDALTEVRNRRYGLDALEALSASGAPGCVCFLDIDRLKAVNDRYGHEEGDRYILRVVRALSERLRSTDTLARLGGDEFLLLLPGRTKPEAEALLEAVRSHLIASASRYRSSVSFGIVELEAGGRPIASEALRRADAGMYAYKTAHSRETGPAD